MAQWMWQYSGQTHSTKVQDQEHALRTAIAAIQDSSDEDLHKPLRRIKRLADRLLSTRIKMLKRRASTKVEEVRSAGSSAILDEFNLESALENREIQRAEQGRAPDASPGMSF